MSSRDEIMEWSRELTIKLIKELEQRRCLWDRGDKFYKHKAVKRKHLKEIAWNLGVDAAEIDKKLMTLKTQYHRELTKIIKSKRSGCPPDEVYVSRWYGFRHLHFLMNTTKPGINLRKTYLQETVMNPEEILEPQISSYHGTSGKSAEDTDVDLNFAESASRDKSYAVEDPAVKVNYICAEDSISDAEPFSYRASNSIDEPESACAEEMPFVQPTYRKTEYSEANPATTGMSSKDSWINKNDVSVVQPLPKRISVVRESEADNTYAEEGLHFGQSRGKRKINSERNPVSTVMNSGEDVPMEEETRFAQPLPRRKTYSGRNLVFDHICSCKCSKDSRDVHSSFGEYVTHELRTLHDPVALLLLKKKITDAIFEAKMTILRESEGTPNHTKPNGHRDDSTPEPSPDASRSSETSLEHQSRNNGDDIKQEIIGEDWVFNAQQT